jgi:hypothetical protein
MVEPDFLINGLVVPAPLVAAVRAGEWRPPRDLRVIWEVFGEAEPDGPQFYDLPSMVRQNSFLPTMSPAVVRGEVVEGKSVGIDQNRAVLIGDLGPDLSIALDYRVQGADPRVLYSNRVGWVEVARNIQTLLERLVSRA